MTKAVLRVKPNHPDPEQAQDEDQRTNGESGAKRRKKGKPSDAPAHAGR